MLKPKQPISFGLLTRGRLSLTFPGWNVSNCNQQNDENEVSNLSTNKASTAKSLNCNSKSILSAVACRSHVSDSSALASVFI